MRCFNCPDAPWCRSTARNGGGCDIDGADDFGCEFSNMGSCRSSRFFEDEEDDLDQDEDDWDY